MFALINNGTYTGAINFHFAIEDGINKLIMNIDMKVTAQAYVSDEMCFLKDSGKEIGIGTALYIHLPDFCGSGYISELNILG